MTKKVDTWMPLLVDKYLGDTTHLTTEQHGAYLLLLMAMWKRDGVLPAEDQQLWSIARMQPARWRASKPVLMEFFRPTEDGSGLTQKRLAEELERSKEHTNRRAAAGSRGASKRWQKDGNANALANGNANGNAIDEPMANGWQTGWQTGRSTPPPSPSEIPEGPADAGPSRAHEARTGDPPPESPPPSAAAVACMAMRQAGMASVNPSDPRLLALLAHGATTDEFADAARLAASKGKPWGWALGCVEGRRRDAAGMALPASAPDPMAWRRSPDGILAKGREFGLQPGPDELLEAFERRVLTASRRRTAAPTTAPTAPAPRAATAP